MFGVSTKEGFRVLRVQTSLAVSVQLKISAYDDKRDHCMMEVKCGWIII